jgi:glucan-binding YG repeat protein
LKEIQQQFINYNKSVRSAGPKFIVIHDTGDPGAIAQNEHDYFSGGNRGASADFFVDCNNIIQIIDTDNFYSWHCGDGHGAYGITNANSTGIEMCIDNKGEPTDETIQNTIDLTKYLMSKYNIGIDNVVRHYDASRKCCPNSFSSNSWARWFDFKERLSEGTVNGDWLFDSDKNKWWYKHSDGTCTKDGWEKIDNKWYLFDSEGWMLYDWKYTDGKWYYLNPVTDGTQGEMKTGWVFDKNYRKWYYCNSDGAMLIGWQMINNAWYYLNTDGSMATGWIKDKGKDYMLYSNGEMVCNCDYVGYHFDSDGVATKL